ncbi:MAG TPA: fibronectin type III domain-containing protein, partial [Ilumatobacteraceae bacterium]|nr:fibronectin type III domain-containing protein [Ilumatobacteraceae bacterium]
MRRSVRGGIRRRVKFVGAAFVCVVAAGAAVDASASSGPQTPHVPGTVDSDVDGADVRARVEADVVSGAVPPSADTESPVHTQDLTSFNRVDVNDPIGDATYSTGDIYKTRMETITSHRLQLSVQVDQFTDPLDADWELDTGAIWFIDVTGDGKDDFVAGLFTIDNQQYTPLYSVINGSVLGSLLCSASEWGWDLSNDLYRVQYALGCVSDAPQLRFQAEFLYTDDAAPGTTSTDFAPNASYSDWLYNTPPGPPTELVGAANVHAVSLTWVAPTTGNTLIQDYVIQYSSNNGASWTTFNDGTSTVTSAVVSGLASIGYKFRVAGINNAGTGQFSNPTPTITPYSVPTGPAAPGKPWAIPGAQSAFVEWSPPASVGSSPLTNYQVQASSDSGSTWTPHGASATTSDNVGGLANAASYIFRVRAVTAV